MKNIVGYAVKVENLYLNFFWVAKNERTLLFTRCDAYREARAYNRRWVDGLNCAGEVFGGPRARVVRIVKRST